MNDLISRSALLQRVPADPKATGKTSWEWGVLYMKNVIKNAPAVDAVERKKLIKKLFPMGVPNTREEWNYSINSKAVYEAIMKTEG